MNENRYWLSRITPRAGIGWKELTRLGGLDPHGQHQALYRLFDLPAKRERSNESTPFLFRTERIEPASAVGYAHPDLAGLPVFYVLSQQMPEDRSGVWQIEAQQYSPDLCGGDWLAFKLRINPVILAKTERSKEEQQAWLKNRQANNFKQKDPTKKRVRHDVVMDAKLKMDWTNLPKENRPTLSQVAYDAGSRWLLDRAEKLGCEFDASTLRVDGHDTWRQRHGKKIELSTLDFEGILRVAEPECFLKTLLKGIGPAKAFGCGLMLVRRI
jgi:CRISPR system Cascade subunit CasE